jgi:uncharacterized protein (TIGR02466 family)
MISFYDVDNKIDQSILDYLKSYIDNYIVKHRCCNQYPNCNHPKEQSNADLLDTNDSVLSMLREDMYDKLHKYLNNTYLDISYLKCWALKNKGSNEETWHTHNFNKDIKEISFIMYLDETLLGTEFNTDNCFTITKPKKFKWLFFNSNIPHQPEIGNQDSYRYVIAGAVGVKNNESKYIIKNLWPTPIYMNLIKVPDNFKKLIKKFDYEKMPSGNGSYTIDKKIITKLPINFQKLIIQQINKYTKDYLKTSDNIKFKITTSWINEHNSNDWAHKHHHSNSMFSGVYYIHQPKNGGNLTFHQNPMIPNVSFLTTELDYKETTEATAREFQIEPEDGLLVIFPSFVSHSVQKNKSTEKRYSLAFNVFIEGSLGLDEGKLNFY